MNKHNRPSNFTDLVGRRFEKLVVIKEVGKSKAGKIKWLCQCDCGNYSTPITSKLISGGTKSCGCIKPLVSKQTHTIHGLRGTKDSRPHALYTTWSNLKQRCFNPNTEHYSDYGAKGITVCEEWRTDFKAFYEWALANGWQKGLQIDRINNDGNYEPGNCRWVTLLQNHRNMSSCVYFTYNSETLPLSEIVEKYSSLPYRLVRKRVKNLNWSLEKALTTIPKKFNNNSKN